MARSIFKTWKAVGIVFAATIIFLSARGAVHAQVINCPAPDQGQTCGFIGPYNMGWDRCDISGADKENGVRILGGQVCSIGGTDNPGYYDDGNGNALPLNGTTPPGWTYTKSQAIPLSVPSGAFTDSYPYYTYGFFGGSSSIVQPDADDASVFSVGSNKTTWSGCTCSPNSVVKPTCPSQNFSGNNAPTLTGGESTSFTVTNMCRPNNGSGVWGSGQVSLTLNNTTFCYTAQEIQYLNQQGYGYQNVTDYTATAPGVCTPKNPPQTCNINVTSVDTGNNPINSSWVLTGPTSESGSNESSQSYTGVPQGTYTLAPVGAPTGYQNPTISPASSQTGVGASCSLAFKVTWQKVAQNISCSPIRSSAVAGQPVTLVGSGGNGNYIWSNAGSPASGSGVSFVTTFPQAGSFDVSVGDSAGDTPGTCHVDVAPAPSSQTPTGSINGNPLTCVARSCSLNTCGTKISWNASNTPMAWVYVQQIGSSAPAKLFAKGVIGVNVDVSWIPVGSGDIFTLYPADSSGKNPDFGHPIASILINGIQSASCGGPGGPGGPGGGPTSTPPGSIGISLAPQNPVAKLNQKIQFTATVTGTNNKNVSWKVVCTGNLLACGTIDQGGLFTAPGIEPWDPAHGYVGNMWVYATSQQDPSKIANTSVVVVDDSNPGGNGNVSITISPKSASLRPNDTQQFTGTVQGSANINVLWNLVGQGKLSTLNGLTTVFTAPNVATTTTMTIWAISQADMTKSATATVLVAPSSGPGGATSTIIVTVTPPAVTLNSGEKQTFTATVSGTPNKSVSWTAAGGSITPSGGSTAVFTAPTVQATTTITVIATSNADPNKFGWAIVTVSPPANPGSGGGPLGCVISANPQQIFIGNSSVLSWACANATPQTTCTINGATAGSNGIESVTPPQTTQYNLSCTNNAGGPGNTSQAVTTVVVIQSPDIHEITP
jgi:hypothetical protein